MRSLSSEQYEVVASFEEDLRSPEEGITEQLQAAEFAALSLVQKQAEKMADTESAGNEAHTAAPDIAAGAPGVGTETLQGNLPSEVDLVEAELVEAAVAEDQTGADIAEPHASSIVEEFEAANLEAAAAEEAAEGASEELEGTEIEDDKQAAVAPATQQLADEDPPDLESPAEVRILCIQSFAAAARQRTATSKLFHAELNSHSKGSHSHSSALFSTV